MRIHRDDCAKVTFLYNIKIVPMSPPLGSKTKSSNISPPPPPSPRPLPQAIRDWNSLEDSLISVILSEQKIQLVSLPFIVKAMV